MFSPDSIWRFSPDANSASAGADDGSASAGDADQGADTGEENDSGNEQADEGGGEGMTQNAGGGDSGAASTGNADKAQNQPKSSFARRARGTAKALFTMGYHNLPGVKQYRASYQRARQDMKELDNKHNFDDVQQAKNQDVMMKNQQAMNEKIDMLTKLVRDKEK